MKLNSELAKMAKIHGICENWHLELKNETDIDNMLEMYVKGIDFCLSNDFPTNDFIRKNFKGKMESHGIHLDETLRVISEPKTIALGKCSGTVKAENFDVCEIFIKNESEVTVMAKGNSFVMIDVFDNAKVHIFTYDNAKVYINRYGGQITESTNETSVIKIIEKNKKTY
jgi:hypothetical protein